MTALSPTAQRLLEIVTAGGTREAGAFVLAELDAGSTSAAVVTDVLAPVQTEMGELWQRNLRSAADEHVATAAIDFALATLAMTVPPVRRADRGTLAVVCGQGDWHTLPARMAAELWGWDGWDVTFLGASLPPLDLTAWLTEARPNVLAVSCSVSIYLPGVLAVSDCAANAGVPCVVGGRGLGSHGEHARALGLRWAASPTDLPAALAAPPPGVDLADLGRRRLESGELEAATSDIVDAALRATAEALPAMSSYDRVQLDHTREDYADLVGHLAASVLCADDAVFADFVHWLRVFRLNRDEQAAVLPIALAVLAEVLPASCPEARRICADALSCTS